MTKHFMAWIYSRNGGTAIEYGLLMAGIAAGIVAVLLLMGDDIESVFTFASSALDRANPEIEIP